MNLQYQERNSYGIFNLFDDNKALTHLTSNDSRLINIFWNRNMVPVCMHIDGISISLEPQQITTSTYFQKVHIPTGSPNLTTLSFNREFYCIQDHDAEVSCNGIIFFGTQDIPIISLDAEEARKFELLHQVFQDEFRTRDNIQGEMLRMLLKRFIIKTTRLAKVQLITKDLNAGQVDIVRQFNVLVDMHFKTKKRVGDYAGLLNRSTKTLSNLFAKYNQKSPLRIIHERIVLEAKRLLMYSNYSSKEIAYELGFEEVTTFNKIFKKITQQTPTDFKKSLQPVSRE